MDKECFYTPRVICLDRDEKFVKNACADCNNCHEADRPARQDRHGHPRFYQLCEEEMDLHSRKNHDYAKGGNPLGNFQRVANILSLYPNLDLSNPAVVAITYMMKQLDASLWMLSNGHQAKVEGHKERWQDVSVYSKIISILIEEPK